MDHTHHQSHHEHRHSTSSATHAYQQETEHHAHHKEAAHNGGYDKHAGHHVGDFLKRFWLCLILTIPVLALSHMIQQWFGFHLAFAGDKYVLLLSGCVIYFYGGMPFFKGMVSEIKDKAIGMMTLVALAITVAFFCSVAVVFGLQGMDFFWELATLIDIMLLGHWLEMRSTMAASSALQSLVALLPSVVHVERNGSVLDVEVKDLKHNEVAIIKPGEKMPADGVVIEGTSFVNESMLTGESVPVRKEKDAKVIAGSVNGDGSLKVKVTGTGEDSYLNKVITLVQSAQSAKSNTQNLADKVAKWLTMVSLVVGVATFIVWYINHDLAFALERMVTVMVTSVLMPLV